MMETTINADWTVMDRAELDSLAEAESKTMNGHVLNYQAAVKRLKVMRDEQNRRDLRL